MLFDRLSATDLDVLHVNITSSLVLKYACLVEWYARDESQSEAFRWRYTEGHLFLHDPKVLKCLNNLTSLWLWYKFRQLWEQIRKYSFGCIADGGHRRSSVCYSKVFSCLNRSWGLDFVYGSPLRKLSIKRIDQFKCCSSDQHTVGKTRRRTACIVGCLQTSFWSINSIWPKSFMCY